MPKHLPSQKIRKQVSYTKRRNCPFLLYHKFVCNGTCTVGRIDAVCKLKINLLTLYLRGYNMRIQVNERGRGKSMEYDDKVKNRLKRVEGQIKGILRMMEEGKDCKEVITQLSASRTAIDRAIGVIVSANLVECIRQMEDSDDRTHEDVVKEAVDLLVKSR